MANILEFPKEASLSRVDGQRRLDSWRVGPTTCKSFESLNPGPCLTCQHRGKIVSPITLGKTLTENNPRPPQLSHVPIQIWNAELWAVRPEFAPPVSGPAFIELKNCWYPPGDKGDEFMRPFLMYYVRGRIQHFCRLDFEPDEAVEGRLMQPWASWILSAAMSINAYNEPTADGWLVAGKTRLTEPYRRICKGIYEESGRKQIEPTGYECHANDEGSRRITISGRGSGDPSACIDLLFHELENYLPSHLAASVSPLTAAILSDIEDEFNETPENIARFCTALTFVDPSDYHGNSHSYPDVDPNFCLGWFEGMCAIKSLPWRQEVKERIAIWWSKRTTRVNYPGNGGVLHKLNHDIRERADGITYRSVFKFAYARGWDG
jgi:hypothetical protein